MPDDSRALVLVISDDSTERLGLHHALKELGCGLYFANDSTSAAGTLAGKLPDVIFLDRSAEQKEQGLLGNLRELNPGLCSARVVLLASRDTEVDPDEIARAAVDDFVWKPCTKKDVEEVLERCRRRQERDQIERQRFLSLLVDHARGLQSLADGVEGRVTRVLADALITACKEALPRPSSLQNPHTWSRVFGRLLESSALADLTSKVRQAAGAVGGDLVTHSSNLALADVLQAVSGRGLSGRLTVRHAKNVVHLFLEEGVLTFVDFEAVSATLARSRDVYTGGRKVPFAEMSRRLAEGSFKRPIIVELAAEGAVEEADIGEATIEMALEVLSDCERDTQGYHLEFERNQSPPVAEDHKFAVSVNGFLLRHVSRTDEWTLFEETICGREFVFSLGGDASQAQRLSALEREVLQALSQASTIADLSRVTTLGTFDVCSALYGLLRRKVIRHASEDSTAAAGAR